MQLPISSFRHKSLSFAQVESRTAGREEARDAQTSTWRSSLGRLFRRSMHMLSSSLLLFARSSGKPPAAAVAAAAKQQQEQQLERVL